MRSGGERHLLLEPVNGPDTDLELLGRGVDARALRERAFDALDLLNVEGRSA